MTKTNVERTLETLVEFADIQRQNLAKMLDAIDALTIQMGVMSEGLVRLTNIVERQEARLDGVTAAIERTNGAIQQQSASIDGHLRVAEQQSASITELSKLVASQAAMVARLFERLAA